MSMISAGIHSSPIIGHVLNARPASFPATNAPERTVVATRAPFPIATYRMFRLVLSVLAVSFEATDLAFSAVFNKLKPVCECSVEYLLSGMKSDLFSSWQ